MAESERRGADSTTGAPRRHGLRRLASGGLVVLMLLGTALTLQRPYLFAPVYRGGEATVGYDAVIRRDRWGVPDVTGGTSADVAYGIGYAHAEDDFATLESIYIAVRGRAGEVLGVEGAKTDYVRKLLGVEDLVRRRYARDVSPEARAVGEAYAAGLNR